jgi:hypothetical protein
MPAATATAEAADAARADWTRPARSARYARYATPWRSRAGLVGWAAALTLLAGAASGGALAADSAHRHAPSTASAASADQLPLPRTDQRKDAELTPAPRAVVVAYVAAINARDWQRVWRLGGDRLSPSYHAMVTGYAATVRDEIRSIRVTGDQVTVQIRGYRRHARTLNYRIDFTVRDGVIAAARRSVA